MSEVLKVASRELCRSLYEIFIEMKGESILVSPDDDEKTFTVYGFDPACMRAVKTIHSSLKRTYEKLSAEGYIELTKADKVFMVVFVAYINSMILRHEDEYIVTTNVMKTLNVSITDMTMVRSDDVLDMIKLLQRVFYLYNKDRHNW